MMKNKWKDFSFKEVLVVKKGFYNKKPVYEQDGTIPFLGATENNNGVTAWYSLENIKNSSRTGDIPNEPIERKLFNGGCIAVTNNGSVGHAYYWPSRFTCSHDINPLYLKTCNMDIDLAMFLISAIEKQSVCFEYARKWRPIRMVKSRLMLPVTQDDSVDYKAMVETVNPKRIKALNQYRTYAEKQLSKIEQKSIAPLSEIEWKAFSILDLFESFIAGKGGGLNHLNKTNKGGINYIGATNRNNGVLCYVEDNETSKKKILPGNCIGFIKNGDGSAGYAIYKAESFISTNDVIYGYADWLNKYTGLFFVAAQDMIENKYSHGYKRNMEHLKGDKIMLPVNDKNEPDYAYMEQYAKNMMYRKYQQYLTYLDKNNNEFRDNK